MLRYDRRGGTSAVLTVDIKMENLREDVAADGVKHVDGRVVEAERLDGQSSGLRVQLQSLPEALVVVAPDPPLRLRGDLYIGFDGSIRPRHSGPGGVFGGRHGGGRPLLSFHGFFICSRTPTQSRGEKMNSEVDLHGREQGPDLLWRQLSCGRF